MRLRGRRPWRRVLAGVAVLLVVAATAVYLLEVRFPARSERLAGTTVELRVQGGVPEDEVALIRDGLLLGDRYLATAGGGTVRGRVEARVARSDGCRPFDASGGGPLGQADEGFLCVDTANPGWAFARRDRALATTISAHELVHVLQAEIGCFAEAGEHEWLWLFEGMAVHLSWEALVAAGRVEDADAVASIRTFGGLGAELGPLRTYEREGGGDQQYALWHLAVRSLVRQAVRTGATPADRPALALRRFCERTAAGDAWQDAFAAAFGLSVPAFYAAFERERGRP